MSDEHAERHEALVLRCECSCHDHVVLVYLDEWAEDIPTLCITAQLVRDLPFWRRLWSALVYVFGRTGNRCRFGGHWSSTLVRYEDTGALISLIEDFRARSERAKDKREQANGRSTNE